jgi:CheY-like chemotaxis protein
VIELDKNKILVIDDDEVVNHINLYLIKETQLFHTMESKTASVGALDYLMDLIEVREKLPGIILVDICMPEIDGFDFLKHLENLFEENQIESMPHVIVLSSQKQDDFERFKAVGCVKKFLSKPLDKDKFNETLVGLGYILT